MAVAVQVKRWTLRELHGLPDDGNKYELIDGELFSARAMGCSTARPVVAL